MENRSDLQELLAQAKRQTRYARWQCILTGAAAVCCGGVFLLVCTMMPQIRELTTHMETVLANLETVTAQLARADLESMVQNVDSLVITSQSGVEQAMSKLSAIDFETLNRAIEDLADVVEPLAKFFNIFN